MEYAAQALTIEINSVTDNPIVFCEGVRIISAGHFHGQPVALALDFLGMALAEVANVAERRIERLVNPALSGLPPFLVGDSGLNSGFMISQYTAAALVSENKVLAHPASVDSIPTSANQEDHVSMGSISARKMRSILENTRMSLPSSCCVPAKPWSLQNGRRLSLVGRIQPGSKGCAVPGARSVPGSRDCSGKELIRVAESPQRRKGSKNYTEGEGGCEHREEVY